MNIWVHKSKQLTVTPPPSTQDHPKSLIWPGMPMPTHQCLLEGSILNNNGIGGWCDKGNMLAVCTIPICPKNKGHSLGSWSHEPLFSEWDHVLGSPFADVILFTYNTRGVPSALNYKLFSPTLIVLPLDHETLITQAHSLKDTWMTNAQANSIGTTEPNYCVTR